MTVHFIKLTLLSALLHYCLVGILAGAAIAHSDGKSLASTSGAIRREPFRNGGSLTETPDSMPGQNQEEAPARKRKSPHEYGPEDILPEARENENPRRLPMRLKDRARQPKTTKRTPLASRPTVTPAPAPIPTPLVTPTPVESAMPAAAVTPSEPQKVKNPGTLRRKLIVSSSLFLLLLLALVYFVAKMRRQLREDIEAATAQTSQGQHPAAGGHQDGKGVADRRVSVPIRSPRV